MARLAILAAVAAMTLAGCQQKAAPAAQGDQAKFAGLDQAILSWRNDIRKTEAACRDGGAGKGCQNFEVTCKAERSVATEEQARGVAAKVVAGMTWLAWDAKRAETTPASAFVEFTNTGGAWSHGAPLKGNLATCETFEGRRT
ncbi:hypothetical protein [Phenylobacterium sp.]|uniref:hypothetical protein n=1 Tax=Phenylobacterium sp. TaxID=1871053 RepID=UPI002F3E8F29